MVFDKFAWGFFAVVFVAVVFLFALFWKFSLSDGASSALMTVWSALIFLFLLFGVIVVSLFVQRMRKK